MALTKDEILAADDRPRKLVPVPEWGGEVYVQTMSGKARDLWEASIVTSTGKPNLEDMRAKLAAACIVDENGGTLFTEADIPALSRKSAAALDRVVKVAQVLNRLSGADLEELKGN